MNKIANKIEVSIGSALEYLDLVQTVTDSITNFMGFDEDTAHWIGMSVRESVTNAIQHGNKLDQSKKVEIRFEVASDYLEIFVKDQGNGLRVDDLPGLGKETLMEMMGTEPSRASSCGSTTLTAAKPSRARTGKVMRYSTTTPS